VPRFDTPTREVASCERRQHLSLSRRLRVEGTDSKKSYTVLPRRSQPSIQRDTWCAIRLLAFSPIATLKNEDQPPPSRETRSAESIQDSGPQYCRSVFSRPSRGNTWQQVEPSRRLAHRDSNAQKQLHYFPMREVPGESRTRAHGIAGRSKNRQI
jgi:hypothetical protein